MFKRLFYSSWRVKTFNFRNGCGKMWTCYSPISRAITHKSFEFNNQYYSIKEMFIHSGTFIKNDKAIKKEITQIIEKENKLNLIVMKNKKTFRRKRYLYFKKNGYKI